MRLIFLFETTNVFNSKPEMDNRAGGNMLGGQT